MSVDAWTVHLETHLSDHGGQKRPSAFQRYYSHALSRSLFLAMKEHPGAAKQAIEYFNEWLEADEQCL